MAIDAVRKLFILLPVADTERLIERLHQMRLVHLSDTLEELTGIDRSEVEQKLKRVFRSAAEAEEKVKKVNHIAETFERFAPAQRNLAENFVTVPLLVTPEQVQHIAESFELDKLHGEIRQLDDEYTSLAKQELELESERESLEPLSDLSFIPAEASRLKRIKVVYGSAPEASWRELDQKPEATDIMTWKIVSSERGRHRLLVACPTSRSQDALEMLRSVGFVEIEIPELAASVTVRLDEIQDSLENILKRKSEIAARIEELAACREDAEILQAYWEDRARKAHAHSLMLHSQRIAVISGYVRVDEAPQLASTVEKEFPSASLILQNPSPQDNVPVSITLSRPFRPVQLLVNMFGLPNYFGFDPTPFLTISFLVFFGICFGDVVYGLMLACLSGYLMHKARRYPGLRNFCAFFFYASISTMIFGALTGSWASNLADPGFLGENNLLLRIRNSLRVFDPLQNTVIALLIALAIGVANQFYAIILRMYRDFRRRDLIAVVFDGGSWLVMLPGLIITVSRMFATPPPSVAKLGILLLTVGAAMLVASQGRREKGLAAKAITGIVSLYGIFGSYGCTSFIGDVLSYSRLLALGFTTTIVGMAFNIIAGLVKDISLVGGVLFVAVLVFGHTFNFAVSIIGAFVHSARLIFLEFFGRFYEGGAVKFQPFGFGSDRVELVET